MAQSASVIASDSVAISFFPTVSCAPKNCS